MSLCSLLLSLETPNDVCAGWSETLLVAHIILLEISCTSSYLIQSLIPFRWNVYTYHGRCRYTQLSCWECNSSIGPLAGYQYQGRKYDYRYWYQHCFDSIILRPNNWASAWDFQQIGMCEQQSLRPACTYVQSGQRLCLSLEYFMIVKLLTEHHLEFLSLKGGCRGTSESTLVKMSNC